MTAIKIKRVELDAPRDTIGALRDFYTQRLELHLVEDDSEGFAVRIGHSVLAFRAASGDERPFYHFALLVPGDRFAAARSWLEGHVDLLAGQTSPSTVFDFDFWNANASYFHDPAGNIAEFIAHRELDPTSTMTSFDPDELVGISEIALVTPDPSGTAKTLEDRLELTLWYGSVDEPGGLGFVGRQAHTLILVRPGRGWLPTGRPAEVHPVRVHLSAPRHGEVHLEGTPYRVTGD